MKYGAGSVFAREIFARSSSVRMVERSMPSPLSAGGALQARIPLAAKMAKNNRGIESRNRFIGVLDVRPPAFDRCRIAGLRSHVLPNKWRAPRPGLTGTFSVKVEPAPAVPNPHTAAAQAIRRRLIMPGIDAPGKRFCIAVNLKYRALTSPCRRN